MAKARAKPPSHLRGAFSAKPDQKVQCDCWSKENSGRPEWSQCLSVPKPKRESEDCARKKSSRKKPSRLGQSRQTHHEETDHDNKSNRVSRQKTSTAPPKRNDLGDVRFRVFRTHSSNAPSVNFGGHVTQLWTHRRHSGNGSSTSRIVLPLVGARMTSNRRGSELLTSPQVDALLHTA